MKESFDNKFNSGADSPHSAAGSFLAEFDRLEDIGDLHFHANSFVSALDYYRQLLGKGVLKRISLPRGTALLRKAIDANLNLGVLTEAERLLDQGDWFLSRFTAEDDADIRLIQEAIFKGRKAVIMRERGRLQEALDLAKRAFAVLAMTDEHGQVATLQSNMGVTYLRLGRQDKAEEFFNDGLSTHRRIGDQLGVLRVLNNLVLINKNRCRWEPALAMLDKAWELAQSLGSTKVLTVLLLNRGIILLKIGRLDESRSALEKGIRLARSLGDRLQLAKLFLVTGKLETNSSRLARAEELLLEGKMLADKNGFLRETVIADEYLGDVLLARGNLEKARYNFELGLEKCRTISANIDLEGELLRRLGELHRRAGRLDEAVALSQGALAVCNKCGEIYEIGFCHATLGQAYADQHDFKQADHHFRQAITTFADQGLPQLWCQAILKFTDARLENAAEPELLLLRRYLMEAQEKVAASVSDEVLCRILERLARVQIQLLQFDDALLTVFELERHAAGVEEEELDRTVVLLRNEIEAGLLVGVQKTENHLQAISSLPGLLSRNDDSIPRNLSSILSAGLERVHADSGFIAMAGASESEAGLRISARLGLTENLARQLATWYDAELVEGRRSGTSFFSRLDGEDTLLAAVPALRTVASSCVFVPIGMHDQHFGLLFLGRSGSAKGGAGFDRSALDFLATYMGFLALFMFEKGQLQPDQDGDCLPLARIESFENIITQNEKMLDVLGLARKVAVSDLTVQLHGETGTGKGLLAYSIHALSKRAKGKFLTINCAAIPETLLESELFGHKRGSFTGAHKDKLGLLAEADGGTIFLDEIGKMPLSMQGKLLSFLDNRLVRPVGSNQSLLVDVRIICASKRDLQVLADQGGFLEDLYYRLLDFPLTIPPLRERVNDILLLTRHFVERFCKEMEVAVPVLGHPFLDALVHHDWPGNVRELEKALKRAIVLAQGEGLLRPEHLPPEVSGGVAMGARDTESPISPLKETLADIECREITRALRLAAGNKSQAARLLKISYPNLLKKIRLFGIA